MLGLSLHGWENFVIGSLAGVAFFGVLVGIASWAVVKLQRIEIAATKEEFEKYKVDAVADRDAKIGVAREEAKVAIEKASNESNERIRSVEEAAKVEIAKAKARADEANAHALETELKLAEFRKSRLVPPDVADEIIEKIKLFPGTKFDIGHAAVGREQWDFLWQLEPIFPRADWVFVEWVGPQTFKKVNWTMQSRVYGVSNVLNVSIEIDPESREKLLPAAKALAGALNSVGLAATVEPHIISSTSINHDAIHIMVGEKR